MTEFEREAFNLVREAHEIMASGIIDERSQAAAQLRVNWKRRARKLLKQLEERDIVAQTPEWMRFA